MPKVHIDDVPWVAFASPQGKYRGNHKEISHAMGAKPNAPVAAGGHPFELSYEKLAPGECFCPYHSHAAQWEMFYFLSGTGTVRAGADRFEVRGGDVVMHPGGEAHQLVNTGSEDLVYLIIADNPQVDILQYPDSKKFALETPEFQRVVRVTDADYWDGEE